MIQSWPSIQKKSNSKGILNSISSLKWKNELKSIEKVIDFYEKTSEYKLQFLKVNATSIFKIFGYVVIDCLVMYKSTQYTDKQSD